MDTKIFVDGGPSSLLLVIEKQKNFEAGDPILIALEPMGESLVVRERAVVRPGFQAAPTGGDKDTDVMEAILKALQRATDDRKTPIAQNDLLGEVKGNMSKKSTLLHQLAEDPLSPVIMERQGKKKMYSLDTHTDTRIDASTDSDSIPPSP